MLERAGTVPKALASLFSTGHLGVVLLVLFLQKPYRPKIVTAKGAVMREDFIFGFVYQSLLVMAS